MIKRAEQSDSEFSLLWKRLVERWQQELDRSEKKVPGGAVAKARGTLRSSLIRRKGPKEKGQEERMETDKEPPQELQPKEQEDLEPDKEPPQELQPKEQEDLEKEEEQSIEDCELTADVSLLN